MQEKWKRPRRSFSSWRLGHNSPHVPGVHVQEDNTLRRLLTSAQRCVYIDAVAYNFPTKSIDM
jgi:hypothetical protein